MPLLPYFLTKRIPMRKNLLMTFILAVIVLTSCQNRQKEGKIQRDSDDDVYNVKPDDRAMNAAIDSAKQTLAVFNKALASHDTTLESISLKVRFKEKGQVEHMWLKDITFQDGKYTGILANEPEFITTLKMGDSIVIPVQDISDWMFIKGNKLHGGYTIKVLRNKMSDAERKAFDQEQGLNFD